MKHSQLKQLIKEEIRSVLGESNTLQSITEDAERIIDYINKNHAWGGTTPTRLSIVRPSYFILTLSEWTEGESWVETEDTGVNGTHIKNTIGKLKDLNHKYKIKIREYNVGGDRDEDITAEMVREGIFEIL